MTPLPLKSCGVPGMNPGDIVTISGTYNRPPASSLAFWAMLVFGPPFACYHIGLAFRRKLTDDFYHIPKTRRGLFVKRELQKYVITEGVTSAKT